MASTTHTGLGKQIGALYNAFKSRKLLSDDPDVCHTEPSVEVFVDKKLKKKKKKF